VKYLLKFTLLTAILLASSATLPAQRFISSPSYSFSGGAGYGGWGGYGYSDYGWSGNGWGYSFGGVDYGCCLHHPEEHPPFGTGYAHGDPEFIQSTFMEYEKALALGKEILEEQAKPQPSLGEIARQLRLRTRKYVPPPAPNSSASPATRSEKLSVIEDTQGSPILCRGAGTACRTSA
jgi:hypothetical protein